MEHKKILKLLNEANDSKFVTDNSKSNYGAGNEIIYNSEVSKSIHCDYSHTCIL